jgi:hypothetical protein
MVEQTLIGVSWEMQSAGAKTWPKIHRSTVMYNSKGILQGKCYVRPESYFKIK